MPDAVEKMNFFKGFNEKMMTLENINAWLRQGSEYEVLTENNVPNLARKLNRIGAGCARNKGINNANGWNDDVHGDGYDFTTNSFDQTVNGQLFYGTEVSTSPMHGINYGQMKDEYESLYGTYRQASGKVLHNIGGSCHMHTAIAYSYFRNENDRNELDSVIDLPVMRMYRIIGGFMVRFMPVLKWLSMTNVQGSRAVALGTTRYDKLSNDGLFEWIDSVHHRMERGNVIGHNGVTDSTLKGLERTSYLRIHQRDTLHWENRILDCNLSPTLMAAWGAMNRAITLFAYDMARYDYDFTPTKQQVWNSREAMRDHEVGYKNVRKDYITESYTEMLSLLYKYFKKASSLGAIEVFNKLIEKPIPAYLEEKGARIKGYDIDLIDGIWGGRNRAKDEVLRGAYLHAIRSMSIPVASNLAQFQEHVARYLVIQVKQAISLYQMFKREFEEGKTLVNITFEYGRLVDMSE